MTQYLDVKKRHILLSTSFLRVIPEEQRSNIFTGWGCWKGSQQGRHRGSHCRFVPQWWGDGGRGRGQPWEALWCCFPTLGGLITWFQKSITCQHNRCTEHSANSNAETGGSTIRKSICRRSQWIYDFSLLTSNLNTQYLWWLWWFNLFCGLKRSIICQTQSRVCAMRQLQWCLTNSAEDTVFYLLIHLVRYSRLRQPREQMAKRKKYWTQKGERLLKTC